MKTRRSYHHGDLRAALIDTAVQLIAERGARSFSLAEASRRLGVAPSAPYAHFSDRDELLAAVGVHALELFHDELVREIGCFRSSSDRLAAVARAYVRFAGRHRPLFDLLFEAGLDKGRHPELRAAEKPIDDTFSSCVRAFRRSDENAAAELAVAVEAVAHGYAMLLLDGAFRHEQDEVEHAAERAARSTLALTKGRQLLSRPASSGSRDSAQAKRG